MKTNLVLICWDGDEAVKVYTAETWIDARRRKKGLVRKNLYTEISIEHVTDTGFWQAKNLPGAFLSEINAELLQAEIDHIDQQMLLNAF